MESQAKLQGQPIHPMLIVFRSDCSPSAGAFDIGAPSICEGSGLESLSG
jgi:hypothetical protein